MKPTVFGPSRCAASANGFHDVDGGLEVLARDIDRFPSGIYLVARCRHCGKYARAFLRDHEIDWANAGDRKPMF